MQTVIVIMAVIGSVVLSAIAGYCAADNYNRKRHGLLVMNCMTVAMCCYSFGFGMQYLMR